MGIYGSDQLNFQEESAFWGQSFRSDSIRFFLFKKQITVCKALASCFYDKRYSVKHGKMSMSTLPYQIRMQREVEKASQCYINVLVKRLSSNKHSFSLYGVRQHDRGHKSSLDMTTKPKWLEATFGQSCSSLLNIPCLYKVSMEEYLLTL